VIEREHEMRQRKRERVGRIRSTDKAQERMREKVGIREIERERNEKRTHKEVKLKRL
jgi:hypothetical protein